MTPSSSPSSSAADGALSDSVMHGDDADPPIGYEAALPYLTAGASETFDPAMPWSAPPGQ